MKSKLDMAHEYALEMLKRGDSEHRIPLAAWTLADSMQAEADKRNGALEVFEDQQNIIESYKTVLKIQFGIDIAKKAFSNATITKTED